MPGPAGVKHIFAIGLLTDVQIWGGDVLDDEVVRGGMVWLWRCPRD